MQKFSPREIDLVECVGDQSAMGHGFPFTHTRFEVFVA
jgi:hypothetical protein